ncbi:MAG: YaaL family protein [Acetatifactor sp.]|nr:YaaL family protein [Acetatifactor sp.]
MKMYFSQSPDTTCICEEDLTPVNIQDSIIKTRQALAIAYAGFDNALDDDLIDSYIYEINSLQKRYKHLTELAALETASAQQESRQHSPIRALVSHVFS